MSLVGTRPPTVDEWEQYELHHRSRMSTLMTYLEDGHCSLSNNLTFAQKYSQEDKIIFLSLFTNNIMYLGIR